MTLDAVQQPPEPDHEPGVGGQVSDGGELPGELKLLAQWVLWRYETRTNDGKAGRTKVPCQADRRRASSTDPRTWCSYQRA